MIRLAVIILMFSFVAELFLFGVDFVAHLLFISGFSDSAAYLFHDPAWKGVSLYASGRWNEAVVSFSRDQSSSYNMGNALVRAGRYEEALEAYERALATNPGDMDAEFNKSLIETAIKRADKAVSTGHDGPPSASPAIKIGGSRDRPQTEGVAGGSGEGLASGSQTQGTASAGGRASKDGRQSDRMNEPHHSAAAGAVGAFGGAGGSGEVKPSFPDLLQERESRMRRRQQEANVHPTLGWLETLSDDPGLYLKAKILAEKTRRLKARGGLIPEDD